MQRFKWLVATFLISLVFSNAEAQNGNVSLQAKVDKNKIRIGDLIKYTIVVEHDENVDVKMPALGAELGMFEIRDYNDLEPQKKDGKVVHQREYVISTFDVGEYEIPPVSVQYKVAGDTVWKSLATEKLKITVESMNPSEEGDIRDIKPPLEIPMDWWRLMRWIFAGFLGIVIIVLIWLFVKRRREGKSLIPRREKPKRPPHEIALEQLEKLMAEDLIPRGKIKQFYIRISDIIRHYFEGRYYIPALEMTTGQLVDAMDEAEIEPEVIELTKEFLELCDLVKFAKYVPGKKENKFASDSAFRIVEMTKIVIEPEDEQEKIEKSEEKAEEEQVVEQVSVSKNEDSPSESAEEEK